MSSDDLEPRVDALETQVHKLSERIRVSEHDAAAARVLAGAADRDTEEFRGELRNLRTEFRGELRNLRTEFHGELRDFRRATTTSFNALREDLIDLRGHVDEQFGRVNEQFGRVNDGFIEMRGKFDATAAGQQRIVELLEGLIAGQG